MECPVPDEATATAVGSDGTIMRTTNGGTTWFPQVSGTTAEFRAVQFVDANIGIVVGNYGTILWKTLCDCSAFLS